MKNAHIYVRVPVQLRDDLERLSKKRAESLSKLICGILSSYVACLNWIGDK